MEERAGCEEKGALSLSYLMLLGPQVPTECSTHYLIAGVPIRASFTYLTGAKWTHFRYLLLSPFTDNLSSRLSFVFSVNSVKV
ncbi:unnamed protein product, partial [Gulo gulo]